MVRFNPSCRCSVWQSSSTRSLAAKDCLRRSRSSSRNPPAERRLKNATPSSHASTSQGRVSSDGDKWDNPDEVFATLPVTETCVSTTGEDLAGASAVREEVRRKNVATEAPTINTTPAPPITYPADT